MRREAFSFKPRVNLTRTFEKDRLWLLLLHRLLLSAFVLRVSKSVRLTPFYFSVDPPLSFRLPNSLRLPRLLPLFFRTSNLVKHEDWGKLEILLGDVRVPDPSSSERIENMQFKFKGDECRFFANLIRLLVVAILALITSRFASGTRTWGEASITMLILRIIEKKVIR